MWSTFVAWVLSWFYPSLDKLLSALTDIITKLEQYRARKAAEIVEHNALIAQHKAQVAAKLDLVARADRVSAKLNELLR